MKTQLKASAYALTLVQIRKMIRETPKERDRLILKLLAATAIRRQELAELKIPDIDFKGHRLRVVGKGGKVRIIPLSGALAGDLKDWLSGKRKNYSQPKKGYVFPAVRMDAGGKVERHAHLSARQITRIIGDAAARANIKHPNPGSRVAVAPHLFRHSWARRAKDQGVPLEVIQNVLGHQSFKTTMDTYGTMGYSQISESIKEVDFI